MGTRADFYVGRGENAEWLGSIAFDGYPDGVPDAVKEAVSEEGYRVAVLEFLAVCDHATLSEQGWPWPWEDSRMTDYAYAFDAGMDGKVGRVLASSFGNPWFNPQIEDEPDVPYVSVERRAASFPNMKQRQAIVWEGKRSGLVIVRLGSDGLEVV